MKFNPLLMVACMLLVGRPPPSAFSGDFFLSTTGSDSNPGTSDLPFKTLQRAADALGPGDTLYIRGGTHTFDEPTTFWNSGSAEAPIRVMNYGSEVAILRAPGFRLIETQASHIHFESSGGSNNLKLTDASYGISVATVSSHIRITGLEIYGMRQNPVLLEGANGIMLLAVSDMEVRSCYLHDNGDYWLQHGIYMEGGSRIVIAGNVIAHNAGWGVHGYGPTDGGDGPIIEKNVIYGNGSNYNGTAHGSGIIISESWRNAVVRNNFCYSNEVHGIQVESYNEGGTPPTNTLVVNNTLVNNGDAEVRVGNAAGTKLYNNILYDGNGGLMISADVALADLASDYNLFQPVGAGSFEDRGNSLSFDEWKTGRNADGNSITGDPLFVNLTAANAHLLASSPAVDRGSLAFAPAEDIDGEARPQGGGVEIGADELAVVSAAIVPACDYDGDNVSDISVYDAATGAWYLFSPVSGPMIYGWVWGAPGYYPVTGDFDGDGTADPAVYDPDRGLWYIYSFRSNVLAWAAQWGGPTLSPVVADYDGDGGSDLAVWDQVSGNWYIKTVSGYLIAWGQQWGLPGATPVPGDYDNDGISDLAIWDPASGNWYIASISAGSNSSTLAGPQSKIQNPKSEMHLVVWGTPWGQVGDLPVTGDFNRDGACDLAVYRPSAGAWYAASIANGSVSLPGTPWGGADMQPVSGDYDGDGYTDLALYQPSTGAWYIYSAQRRTILAWAFQWGGPTMLPVRSNW